ncbi:MAG: Glycosyl transferase family 2 [Parcubacteria group bacterium Athens0714_24]|nr:MAG: Glycosyl transferase family 2 [Parcubacteria group bacterium Athens0714_24]
MKLSIIVPVFNENKTIKEILARIEGAVLEKIEKEIIIVDDYSEDGTREFLKTIESKFKIVYHKKNYGKGRALRTGFEHASGDFIIIQDADLEYDPREYSLVLQPLIDGRADVVYGSRLVGDRPHRVLFFWHYLGNKILTTLSNIFTNLNLTDMETCYKAFSRQALLKIKDSLKSNRFSIEPEITALIAKNKLRIYEVGISYSGRTYEEGKKINWRDGLVAIWAIIRFNLFK